MFARVCQALAKISGKLGREHAGEIGIYVGKRSVASLYYHVNTFKPRTDRGNWVLSLHLEISGAVLGKGRGKASIAVFAR